MASHKSDASQKERALGAKLAGMEKTCDRQEKELASANAARTKLQATVSRAQKIRETMQKTSTTLVQALENLKPAFLAKVKKFETSWRTWTGVEFS